MQKRIKGKVQKRIKGRVQKIKKLKNYFCSFKFYGVRNNEKWSREKTK